VVDDGRGDDDLLNLICEVKGYRGEDAIEKKNTMEAYWVDGVNNTGKFGRWAFAEFQDPLVMENQLSTAAEGEVNQVLDSLLAVEVA
jgi:type III restriction enzyme